MTAFASEQRSAAPAPTRFGGLDAAIALGLFCIALLLRLAVLRQLWDIPFFEHPIVDGRSYDEWARRLAAGDWWGDRVFYQAPAYPYFLGLLYRVLGTAHWPAHVAQMVLGAGSCVLAFAATRELFAEAGPSLARRAATLSGLFLAVYAPAIFFDSLTQKTGLALFLTSLWLWTLARQQRSGSPRWALATGAVLALLALTRENMLIFALALPVWLALRPRNTPSRRRRRALTGFAVGLLLVLAPVSLRNYAVGGVLAPTTSQMGPNFYIGNNPEASGLYAPLLPGRQTPDFEGSDARILAERQLGRRLDAGEVSDFWMERAFDFIRTQPGDWLTLLLAKGLLTVNRVEVPDTEDVYVYAEHSWLLALLLPVFQLATLLALAAAGFVLARRAALRSAPLLGGIVLLFAGSVAAFYVFARYRAPLVPMLLPFAGFALARVPELAKAAWKTPEAAAEPAAGHPRQPSDRRTLALAGVAAAFAFALASLPLLDAEAYRVGTLTNMGNVRYQQGRNAEAEAYYQLALAANEANADLHFHLAALRLRERRLEEAEAHLRRMLELDDSDFRGHSLLATVLRRLGRGEEAELHRRRALQLNPEPGRRARFHGRSGQQRLDALRERRRQRRDVREDPEAREGPRVREGPEAREGP